MTEANAPEAARKSGKGLPTISSLDSNTPGAVVNQRPHFDVCRDSFEGTCCNPWLFLLHISRNDENRPLLSGFRRAADQAGITQLP